MKRVAVIGSGVVGRATGKGISKLGYDVVFADTDPHVLQTLRQEGNQAIHPLPWQRPSPPSA